MLLRLNYQSGRNKMSTFWVNHRVKASASLELVFINPPRTSVFFITPIRFQRDQHHYYCFTVFFWAHHYMSDFLNVILVSFSQLLFSSPALGIMANKVSCKAIHFSRSGSGLDNEPACHRGARSEAPDISPMFVEPVRISDTIPVYEINKYSGQRSPE